MSAGSTIGLSARPRNVQALWVAHAGAVEVEQVEAQTDEDVDGRRRLQQLRVHFDATLLHEGHNLVPARHLTLAQVHHQVHVSIAPSTPRDVQPRRASGCTDDLTDDLMTRLWPMGAYPYGSSACHGTALMTLSEHQLETQSKLLLRHAYPERIFEDEVVKIASSVWVMATWGLTRNVRSACLSRMRPPAKASMNSRSGAPSSPMRVRKCIGMLTGWMGSPTKRPSAMWMTHRMMGRPRPEASTECRMLLRDA